MLFHSSSLSRGRTRDPEPHNKHTNAVTHKYVCAVDELLQPLLGDQQHFIKQEEGSLLLHPVDLKGAFENQLAKPAEVRPSPVHQQGLDFLYRGKGERSQVKQTEPKPAGLC